MASTLKLGKGNWGVKEDSLLAYSDQNNNFIPLPFDFSRASSATVVNKAGLIESVTSGLPRIDFSDDTNGALLLEPQSTNLVTQSEDFSGTYWYSIGNTIVTPNTIISPDGTLNASTVTGLSGTGSNDLRYVKSGSTANNTYTYSVYLKGSGTLRIQLSNGVDQAFDSYITLTSNWKRHFLTSTFNSTATPNLTANIDDLNGQTATQFDIWGAQVEQQSYATSYIPTAGATATRVQDSCLKTNASEIIGQTEGTFVMDFNYSHNQINVPIFETSTTNSNIYALALSDFKIRFWITLSGSNQVLLTTPTIPSEGRHKLAIAYKQNDSCFYLDGVLVGNDTNCSIPAVSELYLNKFNADVLEFTVFKERLSNAELEALTTI